MDSSNYTFKVKKPHHTYVERCMIDGTVRIRERSTGLYLSKMASNGCKEVFGVEPLEQDHWLMYKKNNFQIAFPGSRYQYYIRCRN
jgi:hypothetical protein